MRTTTTTLLARLVDPLRKFYLSDLFHQQSKSGGTKSRTEKPSKQYIEIDAHFERPSRGRGRGEARGRGEGRGRGRGRGGYSDRRQSQTQDINVEDTEAFPSL